MRLWVLDQVPYHEGGGDRRLFVHGITKEVSRCGEPVVNNNCASETILTLIAVIHCMRSTSSKCAVF